MIIAELERKNGIAEIVPINDEACIAYETNYLSNEKAGNRRRILLCLIQYRNQDYRELSRSLVKVHHS